jgi:hypothetical protein
MCTLEYTPKKAPAAEAGLDALRSWPAEGLFAILENKKLHLEGGVR